MKTLRYWVSWGLRGPPDRGQDLAVREDAAGAAREFAQEIEFLRRQLHRRAVAADEALVEIDGEAVDLDARSARLAVGAVSQRRAQTRDQFADAERLLDIVVGAEI